ncbi:MAG: hypothetical protein K2X03_06695 [Bryobacteraceae bacterium]|nr:hypothetical protein [Bryobacteraceae bacterium]
MMNNLVRKSVLAAGLFGFAALPATVSPDASFEPVPDARLQKLRKFFVLRASPISHLSEDFLRVADRHGLDWRLLPSIAIVESSGGKYYPNNNIFGWANGATRFTSIQRSIDVIGAQIAAIRYYKNKDLNGFLRVYNPVGDYPSRVKRVMRALDPQFQDSGRAVLQPYLIRQTI